MNVYIASPLHTPECKDEITKVVDYLRSQDVNVYSPMELKIPNAWDLPNQEWAAKVFYNDIEQLNKADVIVCIYRGFKFAGGTGTAFELGYARAQGKPIIVLCTDITSKQSLMIINSATLVMPYDKYEEAWKMFIDKYKGCFLVSATSPLYIHPDLQDQS